MLNDTRTPEQRQTDCYGCTKASLDRSLAEALERQRQLTRRPQDAALDVAFSLLSDVQEMVALGAGESARQAINRAKYILTNHCRQPEPEPMDKREQARFRKMTQARTLERHGRDGLALVTDTVRRALEAHEAIGLLLSQAPPKYRPGQELVRACLHGPIEQDSDA